MRSRNASSVATVVCVGLPNPCLIDLLRDVPDEIKERIQCSDSGVGWFARAQSLLDRLVSGMDGQHTDDADDGCQDGGTEVIDEGARAHPTTRSRVQL